MLWGVVLRSDVYVCILSIVFVVCVLFCFLCEFCRLCCIMWFAFRYVRCVSLGTLGFVDCVSFCRSYRPVKWDSFTNDRLLLPVSIRRFLLFEKK